MTTIAVAIVGRSIALQEAKEKNPILLSQYWQNSQFVSELIMIV